MWLSNLIFRFFIKRKAKREYRGVKPMPNFAPHIVSPRECMEARQGKYLSAWLSLARECYIDPEGFLYGDLPTKEETPDFIDRLDEELRRK